MTLTPLARYMKRARLSCRAFGKRAGLDFTYVSRLASGERSPGMEAAFKIQKATGGAVPVKAWRRFPKAA